jgi:hypothetical protein
MGKLLVLVVVAVALFVYMIHHQKVSAAKVASCLEHSGATVKRGTLVEDLFSAAADGEQVPFQGGLRKADEGTYDVQVSGDSGYLVVVRRGYSARDVEDAAERAGNPLVTQGSGRIVLLWTWQPSAGSRATVEHCLR